MRLGFSQHQTTFFEIFKSLFNLLSYWNDSNNKRVISSFMRKHNNLLVRVQLIAFVETVISGGKSLGVQERMFF
jgi:hypothetical protein